MAIMKRHKYLVAIRAEVALETVKGEKIVAQIASEFEVHPNQVRKWKDKLLSILPELFSYRRNKLVRVLMRRRSFSLPGFNKKGYFFPTTRRGYIIACDTARPIRYILDIQLAKNLLSWGI